MLLNGEMERWELAMHDIRRTVMTIEGVGCAEISDLRDCSGVTIVLCSRPSLMSYHREEQKIDGT